MRALSVGFFVLCLLAGAPGRAAAAVIQKVQSGTAVNTANGTQTITITSVDTTKSFLVFQVRSNSNRPVGSTVRGRLASSTTIEFVRVTDEGSPATINIQWYVATFGSGVTVQRGEVTQSATTVNVTITAVAAMSQAFVLWSQSPAAADGEWNSDDAVVGDLTSTTNLQFRSSTLNAGHTIAWQVVEFTTAADINVQRGSITTMTGTTTSVTATLSGVNVNRTFVLAGWRTLGGGADVGSRMLRAQLTNSTTVTIDRSVSGSPDDIDEIGWQAVELRDGSIVWNGSTNLPAASATATTSVQATTLQNVNVTRSVAFITGQSGAGQSGGRSAYVTDDILGVASATASFVTDQITLTRNNTAAAADVAWTIVQFNSGNGFKVGSFTKSTSTAPVTQTIAHGLGEVPKALLLWTEGRTDETFNTTSSIAYRAAASGSAGSGVLTMTVNRPTGTVQNDVMVAAVGIRSYLATVTPPTGWVLVRRTENSAGNSNTLCIYYKVAGASEPASYDWTFSASTGSAGGIISFSGVDTNSPIDVESGQNTASGLTHVAPSITTNSANEMIVTFHEFSSGATWTPPAGMNEVIDVSTFAPPNCCGISVEGNYVLQALAGATGTKSATASNDADTGNTQTIALRRANSTAYFGFGMTDGTTSKSVSSSSVHGSNTSNAASRIANKVLTIVQWDTATAGVTLAEADLQSWDDTNIALNWTTNDGLPYVVHYLAIAGTDVSAKVLSWTMGDNTNNGVKCVGFQPNLVLHAYASHVLTGAPPTTHAAGGFGIGAMDADGDQWATASYARDNRATSEAQRGQQTNATIFAFDHNLTVQKRGSFVSMDTDGFTVNFTNASGNAAQVVSLALAGLNAEVGSFTKSTGAAPASQAVTGGEFQPSAILFASAQDTTQANPVDHARFGIGASDGTTEGSSAFADQDNVGTTNSVGTDKTSKVFVKVNNATPAVDAEADLTSFNTDGFTLNWTTNDAVATQILYLAFAPIAVTEVRLLSFTAARYDRGVLLQWKTGYEIDNLGFNLYREIGGVRTKVNPALIAGSGLAAGRGNAVNAELSYARWDLDQASTSSDVTYWLEDLDFNGTSTLHGPITPVAGGLVAPTNVQSSTDLRDLGRRGSNRKVFFGRGEGERPSRLGGRPPLSALDEQRALAARAAIKIGVRAAGWYRVPRARLVEAGFDTRVDPRTLRLFDEGIEQAIRVTGEADGRFDASDAVEFYGTGLDTTDTDTRVYWLSWGGQRGRRMSVGRIAPVLQQPGPTSFWYTLQRKDRSIYFAALKNGDTENWFGPLVSSERIDFTMSAANLDRTAGAASLDVVLQGVTTAPGAPDHRVGVLVNGVEVGEMTFDGQVSSTQALAVPTSVLVDGENVVTLIARNGDADFSLVDVLRLSYWHAYRADADQLRATVERPGRVSIGGFASPALRVVDITDPANGDELAAVVRTEPNGLSSVTVRNTRAGARTLLAFSELTVAAPAFVTANRPSNWHAPTKAHDYLVITHGDFMDLVKPLADLRGRQGYRPAVVNVEDVYDEFNFGAKSPQALKDFLAAARATWRTAPRFVVLAGDATIDPRDYAGFGVADFVPTKQVPMSQVALETASDDWFVDFDDDGLPDLAIGRLPVRTGNQAEAMVRKLVNYDRETEQPWTKDVLLVSDQNDATSNFEQFSASLQSLVPFQYTTHRIDRGTLGSESAHQAIVNGVNDGRLIVNYLGHGSVRIWGREGDLLTTESVPAEWRNPTRLPFVVAMNCLNGLFHGIYDEESLAEALLRAPNGGAIGAWASSSTTSSATQIIVNQELFRLIFQGAFSTVGEAAAAAKRLVSSRDLRRSWNYFGDPALRLIGAPQPASTSTAANTAPGSSSTTGTGSAGAGSTQAVEAVLDARGDLVRLADLNADGRSDLWAYASASGRWVALVSALRNTVLQSGQWSQAWQVVAADLNTDAASDALAFNRQSGEWMQALVARDGSFVLTRGTLAGLTRSAVVRMGRFNRDRVDDVMVYDPGTGGWTLHLADGRGRFATTKRGVWAPGLKPFVGDFDGDGLADVFGYDMTSGRGVLARNDGTGQFRIASTNWGRGWRVSVANLDGNRSADLILYNATTGVWQAAYNNGTGSLAVRTGAWTAGLELHPADFDADGKDDVFGYNPASGQWMVAANRAVGTFTVTGGAWATGFTVATGDVDGDRRADVGLYDPMTGAWYRAATVSRGVFAFESGSIMPGAVIVGRLR